MRRLTSWLPATVLLMGVAATMGAQQQRSLPLRAPLASAVPGRIEGQPGRDVKLSAEEARVAGFTNYLMRVYGEVDTKSAFSLYVGYYASQARGKTIHSPRNCLPGAGWEALGVQRSTIATAQGPLRVNRYLLKREKEQVLVLYWYQGRGRTESNEYRVKWDLLRDQMLHRRSDEALVRVIVPITKGEEAAFQVATRVAREASASVGRALPS